MSLVNEDEHWMKRCLELARLGMGSTSPNPMVGCVVVYKGRILGEGYHHKSGEPHAEVNALNNVQEKELLSESTLYVNLEPCAHHGRTPPCADLIISHKPKRVVVGCIDPYVDVAGKGIERLRLAGIEVDLGVLETECLFLNRRFFTFHQCKRPYVVLKWAQTADGFIARPNNSSKWISNRYARIQVHRWRSEEDAIMVGTNTTKYDNPQLTTRWNQGKNPIRVLIDRTLRIPFHYAIFDKSALTVVVTEMMQKPLEHVLYSRMKFESEPTQFIQQVLSVLYDVGIQSLFVEGGSLLHRAFIQSNYWDEARVITATQVHFEKGLLAPQLPQSIDVEMLEERTLGDANDPNHLAVYINKAPCSKSKGEPKDETQVAF